MLCYLEGLTQEQAARRLRCPVGTVHSRLHRARERLRPALSRRGLAPAAWGASATTLATATARAEVPPALVASTARLAGGTYAGNVPAAVDPADTIHDQEDVDDPCTCDVGALLITMGLTATGAASLAAGGGDGEKTAAKPATQAANKDAPAANPSSPTTRPDPSLAERLEKILADYQAQQDAMSRAFEKVENPREQNEIYGKMIARRGGLLPPDDRPGHDRSPRTPPPATPWSGCSTSPACRARAPTATSSPAPRRCWSATMATTPTRSASASA